jgi:16S rRNA C967 or C1407 C5-methylase (RsmB/RsmF family)/NOL1/NOP2/fmu family ribosome biogenesis protein
VPGSFFSFTFILPMSYLPEQFIASLKNVAGFDEQAFSRVHHSGRQVTSVRFNPLKCRDIEGRNISGKEYADLKIKSKIPWTEHGYYLAERPSFFLDPLWHAGVYYVQDASSMCLEFILKEIGDLSRPLRILDLCAAPGGKSTLVAGLISDHSLLVSNEVIRSRTSVLEENMIKWGAPHIVIAQNDAADFGNMQEYFDIILADVPCSGSGLFRKDPEAANEWSPEQVQICSRRQRRILADVMPSLKENGILIYSTCSFSPEENEQICDYLMQEFPLESIPVPFNPEWNIVESISAIRQAKGYRFYPDKLDGEGFFISCFRNKGRLGKKASGAGKNFKKRSSYPVLSAGQKKIMAPWIRDKEEMIFFLQEGRVIALPAFMATDREYLCQKVKVMSSGISCGKIIREQLIPDHALAMSLIMQENIAVAELTLDDALRYLRKEDITLPNAVQGWLLTAYQGYPLGWMKGVQGRVNNYYPVNWRIRKQK